MSDLTFTVTTTVTMARPPIEEETLAPEATGWSSAKTYNGSPAPGWAHGKVVGSHTNGDYWVAGNFFNGKLKFGNVATLTSTGKVSGFLAKFSSGNSPLAAVVLAGSGNGQYVDVTGLVVDSTGSVWIQGYYEGTLTIGGTTLPSSSWNQLFLAKFSASATPVIVISATSTNDVPTGRLAIDSSNNIYSVGSYKGSLSVAGLNLPNTSYNDVFVLKLSSTGVGIASQVSTGTSSHYAIGWGIVVDSNGIIYVTGQYNNSTKFGSNTLSAAVYGNAFVAKLTSSLSWNGAVAGTLTGTTVGAEAFDIELDSNNQLYITGRFGGGSLTLGSTTLTSSPFDAFVAVLNTSLVFGGANQSHTSDGKGMALARDNAGNVWAAGIIKGSYQFDGFTGSSSNYNTYLTKLNSSCGFVAFTSTASSSGSGIPNDIIGNGGNIVMTGDIVGNVSFGSKNVSSSSTTAGVEIYTI